MEQQETRQIGPMEAWLDEHGEQHERWNSAIVYLESPLFVFAKQQDAIRSELEAERDALKADAERWRKAFLHALLRTHESNPEGCDGCADVAAALKAATA